MDREALAIYGLKKCVASYALELHELVGTSASADALHTVIANVQGNLGWEVTFDGLVEEGRGVRCHDCGVDVAPCDEDGYPTEGWELYMVDDQLWRAAAGEGFLCIGCLEARIGRRLTVDDFTDCGLNTLPSAVRSERAAWSPGRWEVT